MIIDDTEWAGRGPAGPVARLAGRLTPRPNPSRPSRGQQENAAGYLFLLPWFAGLLLITLIPLGASLYLSFTDYSILQPPGWIGLENYRRMFFDDPRLLKSLAVTVIYVVVSVPLSLIFALVLALVLDSGLRGLTFYRAVYYLPSLLGSSVAIAILWRQVFGADGLLNGLLGVVGIQGPAWITDPDYSLSTLIVLHIWSFGSPMIIFLAGLRQIPTELYEAARVDGAGTWSRLFRITIPLLTPVIFFNLVLQMIGAFQSFTGAFIVSGGSGGPADSTLFYSLYLYERAFTNFDMGYASAMAWVLLLIIAAMTGLNFLVGRKWVFYGDQ
ncbi:carbohydrate ABC transporter permease [Microlunatus speluncae]|uniref:carbohydrate ABC transporter permease n=1 Tax=Microlunatus speluncae TaxID=2594267 RepID=UPI001266425C|nr:sugar ABC transporter permease [Microlunatus speluncae]